MESPPRVLPDLPWDIVERIAVSNCRAGGLREWCSTWRATCRAFAELAWFEHHVRGGVKLAVVPSEAYPTVQAGVSRAQAASPAAVAAAAAERARFEKAKGSRGVSETALPHTSHPRDDERFLSLFFFFDFLSFFETSFLSRGSCFSLRPSDRGRLRAWSGAGEECSGGGGINAYLTVDGAAPRARRFFTPSNAASRSSDSGSSRKPTAGSTAGFTERSSTARFPASSSPSRGFFFPTADASSAAPPGRSPSARQIWRSARRASERALDELTPRRVFARNRSFTRSRTLGARQTSLANGLTPARPSDRSPGARIERPRVCRASSPRSRSDAKKRAGTKILRPALQLSTIFGGCCVPSK